MPKFSQWVRNKFSGFRKVKDDSKVSKDAQLPCIPVLPQQRQYILTPTPSSENLVQNSNTKIAFFAKLPPELRQQIYIAAFGGRTIHIDLRFDHPETPGPAHARLDPERQRDRTVLPAWIWWSSVCHRNPVFEACEDQCRGGSLPHTACFLYPGNMPEKCFIGVMGWLLTCRQAYAEGIDVLYRTNTIHISSLSLMGHLPRLLLPQHLANITALELSWDIYLPPVHSSPSWEDWPAYKAFLVIIASGFPSLKSLYISIQVCRYLYDLSATTIESYEQKLLEPVDEMVRKLSPKLQDCQIAPQHSLYVPLRFRAESIGAHTESGGYGGLRWERFWRPLDMEFSKQTTNGLGYWVRQGRDDTRVSFGCCGM